MFCAKCGKKIDDDSTFCPYCGQKVNAPVEKGKPSRGISEKPGGLKNKLPLVGIAVAVVAVAAVVFSAVKIIGGSKFGKTPVEKIFAMSWEESSETTTADIKAMLDEEGILYKSDNSDYYGESLWIGTPDTFMGNDCLFLYIDRDMDWDVGWESGGTLHTSVYGIAYETTDAFKEGRKELEKYLSSRVIKNSKILSINRNDADNTLYVVEESDKNIQAFIEKSTLSEGMTEEEKAGLEDCHVYKLVQVCYTSPDDYEYFEVGYFTGDKSYIDYMCEICVSYTLMSEEDYISFMAGYGYDAVKGKEIDIEGFRESVSDAFIESLDMEDKVGGYSSEKRREYENRLYSRLYMMEKYNFDTDSGLYFKTDEEKQLWYVKNYGWDADAESEVDLSDYRDSADIYCAVNYNYDIKNAEYFESDLDKALYLADRDYKADTGESFGGTDDKRLYFMQNYGYDTSSQKQIDDVTVETLFVYADYIENIFKDDKIIGYNLIYIDDDDIPECLVWVEGFREDTAGRVFVLSNKDGDIQSVTSVETLDEYSSFSYTPQSGEFLLRMWSQGFGNIEISSVFTLKDRDFDFICSLETGRGDFETYGYKINNQDYVDFRLDEPTPELDAFYEQYGKFVNYDSTYFECRIWGDRSGTYATLLAAYDALRTTTYSTYEYCIYQFEVKDGILTVAADDGEAVADGFGLQQPFSFSYPVAEDCIWENGYWGVNGYESYEQIDAETAMKYVKEWRETYETYPDDVESPTSINFEIVDDEIIRVYRITP